MYSPEHYRADRPDLTLEIIKRYDFATLITQGAEGLNISHLPLLLTDDKSELIGHCARANPQWRDFTAGSLVTAIFQGPHAYISPAWYQDKPGNVPTWNYVSAHVTGEVTIIQDPQETYRLLQQLTEHHESRLGTGWSLPPQAGHELSGLMQAIVAFRIQIQKIDSKFKLSQKQDPGERATVIRELHDRGLDSSQLAAWMKKI